MKSSNYSQNKTQKGATVLYRLKLGLIIIIIIIIYFVELLHIIIKIFSYFIIKYTVASNKDNLPKFINLFPAGSLFCSKMG